MDKKQKKPILSWLVRDKYQGDETANLMADFARLRQGEPLPYIIGWVDFLGCHIDLTAHPLIPRPETEFWAEQAILEAKEKAKRGKIRCLDLGAGSGCLGLAVLKHCPNAVVDFVEKDKKLIPQIAKNLKLNKIPSKRFQIFQSDLFSYQKDSPSGKYDYIFTNPPYIPAGRKLAKSVIGWEPKQALFAGKDGLIIIKKILREAKKYLKPNGELWLEFDSSQKKDLAGFLSKSGYENIVFHKDQYDRWRYVTVKMK